MNIFSSKFINIISIIITLIIFVPTNFYINKLISKNNFTQESVVENISKLNSEENILKEEKIEKPKEEKYSWGLQIEAINLYAPIEETTEMKILNKAIGHFEETPKDFGNIGLAAHNRGYEKNYFENLKNVKTGDEIIYTYNNSQKIYIVDKIENIRNTDWSYLENTKKNKLTLITCLEGNPDLRLCVQASEKSE